MFIANLGNNRENSRHLLHLKFRSCYISIVQLCVNLLFLFGHRNNLKRERYIYIYLKKRTVRKKQYGKQMRLKVLRSLNVFFRNFSFDDGGSSSLLRYLLLQVFNDAVVFTQIPAGGGSAFIKLVYFLLKL